LNFRTEITPEPVQWDISYHSKIVVAGSCFAERIGHWFDNHRFQVEVNPNGIIFHPTPLVRTLTRALDRRPYMMDELAVNNGVYCSFDHHGSFSQRNADDALRHINARHSVASNALCSTDVIIITWGSAWAYHHAETNAAVANCHKFPGTLFRKSLTPIHDIVAQWADFLEQLKAVNPGVKCILSLSPVRYLRDGAHGNQLSKAHLLLAAEELVQRFDFVHYFPSYEIVLDELRDYRFYAEDMMHPSSQAVEYVITKFATCFMSEETRNRLQRMEPLLKFLAHRPIKINDAEWNLKIAEKQEQLEVMLREFRA
jgi:hypothetical protein